MLKLFENYKSSYQFDIHIFINRPYQMFTSNNNSTPSFGGQSSNPVPGTAATTNLFSKDANKLPFGSASDNKSIFGQSGQQTTTSPFSGQGTATFPSSTQPTQNNQPNIFSNSQPTTTPNQQGGNGLFSNNSAGSKPGLFGSTQPAQNNPLQPSPISGGNSSPLFGGNQPNTAKQPAKLFSQNPPATTTGAVQPPLSPTPSFGQSGTTNLFNQPAQNPTQPKTDQPSPLFGGNQPTQPTSTGIQFGLGNIGTATTPATTTTAQPATGATTTTTPATSTPAPTNLFNTNTPSAPTFPAATTPTASSNSLFGNNQKPGGMFANTADKPTTAATQPSTLGQPAQSTTQPEPPKTNLFSNNSIAPANQTTNPPTVTATSTVPKNPMQQTKINNPGQQATQNQSALDPQRIMTQFESSTKTIGEAFEEWKRILAETDRQLIAQCNLIKEYEVDRRENHTIINNFQQLAPVVSHNQKNAEAMLDNIEKRQKQMMSILMEIEQQLGTEGNSKYRSDNSIAMQLQSCRNIRKQINAEDQRYSGYQDEDPSNQQLRNIFFNLDSVENQIRRLTHVLDHFFGKMTN